MPIRRVFALLVVLAIAAPSRAPAQELRGHGGPVRALALSADGSVAVTGSFDQSVIRWDLKRDAAEAVLRAHQGAVNAAVILPDRRFVTAGEDGKIMVWPHAGQAPERVLEGHTAPIVALAASPDGRSIASAAWDETVRLWSLADGTTRVLEGHRGNVNGVAFTPQGAVVSSGYDATVRLWPADGTQASVAMLPAALNGVAVAADGEIVVAGADGRLRFLAPDLKPRGEMEIGPTPIIALALSRDGARVAAGGIRGSVAVVDRGTRQVTATLVGPGMPVWSLAFTPDGRTIMSGGTDRVVRRWNAVSGEHIGAVVPTAGEDPLAQFRGERGAEVFRACAACHTLTADGGNRAGPTLHGLFGRRIATVAGYAYSEGLKKLDIVWTRETVAKLFEIGPTRYTPGTKMPEQMLTDAADREALVAFLEKATAPH
jgi:cytochrome c